MNEILISIISMVGLGVFFAVILAIASKTMSVKEDKRVVEVEEALPGLNCGACGYTGCQPFAVALLKNEAPVTGCLAGGEDTADKLAELLGLEKGEMVKSVAVLHCNADVQQRKKLAEYKGIGTCHAAEKVFGGGLACGFGCLGLADCARVCPFGAISMANGLPIVNTAKCTSCGKCAAACPRGLYTIEKFLNDEITAVACSSIEKCATVRNVCGVGCTGCKICEKLSGGVFEIKDNLAKVSYEKATAETDWNKVIEKCPMKVIGKVT